MPTPVLARLRAGPHFLRRVLGMAAFWTVLVGGEVRAVGLTALTVLAAAATGMTLRSGVDWRLYPMGLVRFLPLFLWGSVVGGFDVAVRAFRRRPRLAPELVRLRLRLAAGTPPAMFFVGLVSVLPGTLCAAEEGQELLLHVLDRSQPNEARLRRLEDAVGAMFGILLPPWERTPE